MNALVNREAKQPGGAVLLMVGMYILWHFSIRFEKQSLAWSVVAHSQLAFEVLLFIVAGAVCSIHFSKRLIHLLGRLRENDVKKLWQLIKKNKRRCFWNGSLISLSMFCLNYLMLTAPTWSTVDLCLRITGAISGIVALYLIMMLGLFGLACVGWMLLRANYICASALLDYSRYLLAGAFVIPKNISRVVNGWIEAQSPPLVAIIFVKVFVSYKSSECLIGGITEAYSAILIKYGPRAARLWFWYQALNCILAYRAQKICLAIYSPRSLSRLAFTAVQCLSILDCFLRPFHIVVLIALLVAERLLV